MIPKIRQHVLNSNQSKFVRALNQNPNKIKSIVEPLTFPLNNVIKQKVSTEVSHKIIPIVKPLIFPLNNVIKQKDSTEVSHKIKQIVKPLIFPLNNTIKQKVSTEISHKISTSKTVQNSSVPEKVYLLLFVCC